MGMTRGNIICKCGGVMLIEVPQANAMGVEIIECPDCKQKYTMNWEVERKVN